MASGGGEDLMPVVSQAQRRFMYATKEGKTDAPPSVGEDFINASHGVKGLPEHVGKKKHPAQHGTAPGVGKLFNRRGAK